MVQPQNLWLRPPAQYILIRYIIFKYISHIGIIGETTVGERGYITNLTKFYTLVLLNEGPKHGYELMDELERKLGKKTSAGQIYPLLKKLEGSGLISHTVVKRGDREKKVYTLTGEGKRTASRVMDRFSDVVSIILEPKLTKCAHCGCKIYEGGYKERIEGKPLMFCCVHCADSYKHSLQDLYKKSAAPGEE